MMRPLFSFLISAMVPQAKPPLTLPLSLQARFGELASQRGRIRKRMRRGERTPELRSHLNRRSQPAPSPLGERVGVRGPSRSRAKTQERSSFLPLLCRCFSVPRHCLGVAIRSQRNPRRCGPCFMPLPIR